jgi:hypothetical protein
VDNVPRFGDAMAKKRAPDVSCPTGGKQRLDRGDLNRFPRQNLELSSGIFYILAR